MWENTEQKNSEYGHFYAVKTFSEKKKKEINIVVLLAISLTYIY